ncbi:UNVERIFIED_CONTAM: Mitochondrial outer membrane protein porin 2 [Sesamum calycinum]|uniref:Mitochondrial outer membrane protein porin 2 n=1 Tax=Sesamum calycinum TaxID=2727403 RepID=A0AAW2PBL3_9LAMI
MSSSRGPGLFSDFGKKAKEVLTKSYSDEQTVVISSQSDTGLISTTLTVADILPSSKTIASWKLPDYNSGKIEIQYFHEHSSLTAAVGLNKSPALDVSATIGTPCVAFGTEASYLVSSGTFMKYNAGFSLKTPNVRQRRCSKGIVLAPFGSAERGLAVGEITRKFSTNENTLTVGCSYVIDPHTTVKAKLNNHGNLGSLVQHELKPNPHRFW